ncbi:hypothetical protein ABIA58_001678 [Pseudomonas frederiksbergensis]
MKYIFLIFPLGNSPCQSDGSDGAAKYSKGHEQHMAPESGFGDTPHIKWYNNGGDGHIFYDVPN